MILGEPRGANLAQWRVAARVRVEDKLVAFAGEDAGGGFGELD
jgi:hypothetical protein